MRRVKCVFDDWYLAGRETVCSKCEKEKTALKKAATEVASTLGDSNDPALSLQLDILRVPMVRGYVEGRADKVQGQAAEGHSPSAAGLH